MTLSIHPFSKKTVANIALISCLFANLTGCATQYSQGEGVIIAEKKVGDKNYLPHDATKDSALAGGKVGALGGAGTGLFMGCLAGASFPAVIGAMGILGTMGAAVGGALGGGAGYLSDLMTPGAGMYEFTVKPDNASNPLIIKQYTTPIPLHSPVQILKKENVLFLKTI